MKKVFCLLLIIFQQWRSMACPGCEARQPKILRGITHGAGPSGNWDYLIVAIVIVIVLFTLFFSIKWLIHPGEKSPQHIKRLILNMD
jgi:hypothetical protein